MDQDSNAAVQNHVTKNFICLICSKSIIFDWDRSPSKCDKCDCIYCDECFVKRCDIGGGQDQDVYFDCPKCNLEIIRDKDLLEYFLCRCGFTLANAKEEYRKWCKSGKGDITIKYDVKERHSYW